MAVGDRAAVGGRHGGTVAGAGAVHGAAKPDWRPVARRPPGAVEEEDFEAIEQGLNADRTDYQCAVMPSVCGQAARYAACRPKTFTTVLGPLTRDRTYCDTCGAGM